jgi:hypothetical protein
MTIRKVSTVVDGEEYGLAAGRWEFDLTIGTGPTTFEKSKESSGTFKTMTDGTFTVTTEGVFDWGEGNIFKAQLGAGDSLSLAKVR